MQEQIAAMFEKAFPGDVICTETAVALAVKYTGSNPEGWFEFIRSFDGDYILHTTDNLEVVINTRAELETKRELYSGVLEELGFHKLAEICRPNGLATTTDCNYKPTVGDSAVIALYSIALVNENQPIVLEYDQAETILKQSLERPATDEEVNLFLEIQKPFNLYLMVRESLATLNAEMPELVAKRDAAQEDSWDRLFAEQTIASRLGRKTSFETTMKALAAQVRILSGQ